ncbi:hypothetical protein D9M68_787830 [compost metagenome]
MIKKSTRLFAFSLFFVALTLSACKKTAMPDFTVSYLRVINTAPNLATYNVYANTLKVNAAPLPFGGTTTYQQFKPGTQDFKFTSAGDIQSLLDKKIELENAEVYSLYLIGQEAQLDAFWIKDIMPDPKSDKAFIKFVNISPDAPIMSLSLKDGDQLIGNKAYKEASEFIAIEPKTYSFEFKSAIDGTVETSLNDVELVAGRYYTLITRGLRQPGVNEQPLSAQSILNN